MRNYPLSTAARPLAAVCAVSAFLLLASLASVDAAAQASAPRPRYLVELGAAGGATRFAAATNLRRGFGGTGRLGLWLPLNFEIEGEGNFFSTTAQGTNVLGSPAEASYSVRTLSGALLYNIPAGERVWVYLKAGYGQTAYSSDECDRAGVKLGPCGESGGAGKTGVVLGGGGLRVALGRSILVRAEVVAHHSSVGSTAASSLTNVGGNLGLSVMLGTKVPGDADGDGVLDNADRCPGTPRGAVVDARGCPRDSDRDGVADGLDRCPNTPPGTAVDATGCTRDADHDGVADDRDRCPDTPQGATVDARGCPTDSDHDGVYDGLDRCPDTPEGATVDATGCPGDEDGDGVLDGLDRCPRTPPGTVVNSFGCPPNQDSDHDGVADGLDRCPDTPPGTPVDASGCPIPGAQRREPAAAAQPTAAPTTRAVILTGVTFAQGSARLSAASHRELDSVATALKAQPRLVVEIGGHTDAVGSAAANLTLSRLRAEAVRRYLIGRGIPAQRMTAKGYGSSEPLVAGDTPAARARNRRVEIKPLAQSP